MQSLHTTVLPIGASNDLFPLEVHICTAEMHHLAEFGIAGEAPFIPPLSQPCFLVLKPSETHQHLCEPLPLEKCAPLVCATMFHHRMAAPPTSQLRAGETEVAGSTTAATTDLATLADAPRSRGLPTDSFANIPKVRGFPALLRLQHALHGLTSRPPAAFWPGWWGHLTGLQEVANHILRLTPFGWTKPFNGAVAALAANGKPVQANGHAVKANGVVAQVSFCNLLPCAACGSWVEGRMGI